MKTVLAAIAVASLGTVASGAMSPPIVNPGAPGAPSRTITAEESLALSRTGYTPSDVQFMQHMIVHHNQAVEMVALIAARSTHRGVSLIGERISLSQQAEMEMMSTWLSVRGEPIEDATLVHGSHNHHGMHGGHDAHAHHGDHDDHNGHDHAGHDHSGHDHSEHGHSGHAHHSGGSLRASNDAHADHDHSDHAGHDHSGHDHGAHAHHGDHDTEEMDPREIALMPGMLSPAQMDRLQAAEGVEFDRQFLEGMILHHQGAIDMVDFLLAQPGSGEDPQLSEFLSHVVADQSAEILRMRNMLAELDEPAAHAGHH